jgi:hypothetical protein
MAEIIDSGQELAFCYWEGFRAFVKHVGQPCGNPYAEPSAEYAAFAAGWREAGDCLCRARNDGQWCLHGGGLR